VSLTGARVLIVDDDEGVRDLFERAFAREGFTVRGASDGEEALRLMTEEQPQLIVLDLMMPRVNGIEVLAAMRRQATLADVPVVVTTATATSAYDLRDFRPLRVMRKPFELARLVQSAREMLGGTKAAPAAGE
jgi:two-component system, OmpR family, response regulator ArlR